MPVRKDEEIIKDIIDVIDAEIAPMLISDGGNIEFVGYKDGIVQVKLQGACRTCPMASITLQNIVERILQNNIPEIALVERVMDDDEEEVEESQEEINRRIALIEEIKNKKANSTK